MLAKDEVFVLRVQYEAMGNDADRTINRAMAIVNAASAVSANGFYVYFVIPPSFCMSRMEVWLDMPASCGSSRFVKVLSPSNSWSV